ncbi:hypothetical protein [Cellulomonas cellasea]|uniref:Peptidase S9 n=1 Tax=Cellulomonas cellasea TaxID=43670 RepID=A0A7W4UBF4_9CELL|nr:hypothetical protein [Cellulomonas cellasea]MBB2921121.1 hypothetical protein [Cellulomonas cellasea]
MTTTRTASRVLTALASGLATTAYYATPDVISSRTARGWVKAGLAAASFAVEVPQLLAERAARRAAAAADAAVSTDGSVSADGLPGRSGRAGADGPGADGAAGADPSPSGASRRRLVALGVVAVAGAASVVGTVAAERWLFRRGEARAAAGVRFAHTRAAAVLGALTVALSLIPTPADDEGAGGEDVRTA